MTDGDRRRTALVTGASSGLGLELARCFARDGFDVALVARTEPALRALADVLSERHGVQTHVLPFDLSEDAAPDAVMAELASRGVTVDALVNSAGFTQFGPLAETDERTLDELVHVAKAFIGHYGAELVHECVQLHGGIGVTFDHDLHLFVRRGTVDRALYGTPADHRQ